MRNHWFGPLVASAILAAVTSGAAAAPPTAGEQAIEYRHSVYHVIAWNVGPMNEMIKGKIPYDPATFAKHAARVAMMTPMLLEGFPPDSNIAGKTHAKPGVWTDRATFENLLKKLETRSATLADVAKGGDLAKVKPAFNDLLQACKDCHEKFREKDED
ncbi:MAG TPA: cytochrome c [Steroidobacteraceae bacterium]|nr:cytochrome c [Steroidobacteraceae bacterium]